MSDESRLIPLPLFRSTDVGPVGYESRFSIGAKSGRKFKMRAQDSGRVPPGYVNWIAPVADFDGAYVSGAAPPLLGTIVPGTVSLISQWEI